MQQEVRHQRAFAKAVEVLDGRERATRWMAESCRALGSVAPRTLFGTDAGADAVLDELGRLEHGVVA